MMRNAQSAVEYSELKGKDVAHLVGRRDPVILEIGANIGRTTLDFLREMPEATIYCFEPDPRAISEFKKNVGHGNVELFECAVGNANGMTAFYQSTGIYEYKDWNQSGSIKAPKDHLKVWPEIKFENKIEVPIVRLDDWAAVRDIKKIDFIWADAQGAEGDLILGGLNTINRSRYFYTEYGFRELYEGQISLDKIKEILPNFSIKRRFATDALFENLTVSD